MYPLLKHKFQHYIFNFPKSERYFHAHIYGKYYFEVKEPNKKILVTQKKIAANIANIFFNHYIYNFKLPDEIYITN